jgi:UDP-N-acetylglucosamine--N-acetylmuramyl-(pentapeptide) pyrophosphoryl-undecaprenol N-acetylglucosamine transferase
MNIAISGGGTGGGVYPALAIASALKALNLSEGLNLLWIGGSKGPERDLVTREGIDFKAVSSAPIAGMGLRILLAPFLIGWGLIQSLAIIAKFKPRVLLITGGWVTIPPALACWLMRIPVVIYCPDVEPGGTIGVLRRIARKVGTVSPESARFYNPGQVVEVGYPLRADLLSAAGFDPLGIPLKDHGLSKKDARKALGMANNPPVLLVFGGSTGARSINKAIVANLAAILSGWQLIHVTGRLDAGWVREAAANLPPDAAARYYLFDYLHSDAMAQALSAADLVVSRSGASILGEFPLFGLPAILVPYPYAWRYQKTNADVLAARNAAIRMDDERLGDELVPALARLLDDAKSRDLMARASAELRRPDAAAKLAALLAEIAQHH